MESAPAVTLFGKLPRTESYFSRCASVFGSVRSFTATNSRFGSCKDARRTLRPMRPKPLIPTFIATSPPYEKMNRSDHYSNVKGTENGNSASSAWANAAARAILYFVNVKINLGIAAQVESSISRSTFFLLGKDNRAIQYLRLIRV